MPIDRWTWPEKDDEGARRLWSDLNEHGFSFFRMPDALDDALVGESFVERLLGRPPIRVSTALIKPQPAEKKTTPLQRRAYPMNAGPAQLHVDNPLGGPVPPQLQIMICRQAASEGGATTLLDVWRLVDKLADRDPDLYRDVFEVTRSVGISGKTQTGPLLALRHGRLVLYYGSAVGADVDPVGQRLRRWIEAEPLIEFRAERGDVYVNNNHRTLHGRTAFADTSREFLRFLAWPSVSLAAPTRFVERAARAAARHFGEAAGARPPVQPKLA